MHKLIYGVPKVVNGRRRLRWATNLLGEEVNIRAKEGKEGKTLLGQITTQTSFSAFLKLVASLTSPSTSFHHATNPHFMIKLTSKLIWANKPLLIDVCKKQIKPMIKINTFELGKDDTQHQDQRQMLLPWHPPPVLKPVISSV